MELGEVEVEFTSEDVKEWINKALGPPVSPDAEPLDDRISLILTKLELQASDIDAAVQDAAVSMLTMAPKVVGEVGALEAQVRDLRAQLDAQITEAATVERRSEAAIGDIRDTYQTQRRIGAAVTSLRESERVARLLLAAERALASADAAAAAASLAEVAAALGELGPQRETLCPGAEGRRAALHTRLAETMRPPLLRAIASHDASAMAHLVGVFQELSLARVVRECYVQCRQGPVYERWSECTHALQRAREAERFERAPTEPARSVARCAAIAGGCNAITGFWRFIGQSATAEASWLQRALPDEGALLALMLKEALVTLQQPVSDALDQLTTALARGGGEGAAEGAGEGGGEGAAEGAGEGGGAAVAARAAAAAEALSELERAVECALDVAQSIGAVLSSQRSSQGGCGEGGGEGGTNGGNLNGGNAAEVQLALLVPLDSMQEEAPRRLAPLLGRLPTPPGGGAHRTQLRTLAAEVDAGGGRLFERIRAAVRLLLPLAGPLGSAPLLQWAGEAFGGYVGTLERRLAELRTAIGRSGLGRGEGRGQGVSGRGDDGGGDGGEDGGDDGGEEAEEEFEAADEGEVQARQSLQVLCALGRFKEGLTIFVGEIIRSVRERAEAESARPLATPRQCEAALALDGTAADPEAADPAAADAAAADLAVVDPAALPQLTGAFTPLSAMWRGMDTLLLESQRLALDALCAPLAGALASAADVSMHDEWRGALPSSVRSAEQAQDEEEARAALLAFAPLPKPYVTQVGEYLLGMPVLLEPFANAERLPHLLPQLRAEELEVDTPPALAWLHAASQRAAALLCDVVHEIPAFSPMGSKQLATDARYLQHILTEGLGLPQSAALDELGMLLSAERPVTSDMCALTANFARTVAMKRGISIA